MSEYQLVSRLQQIFMSVQWMRVIVILSAEWAIFIFVGVALFLLLRHRSDDLSVLKKMCRVLALTFLLVGSIGQAVARHRPFAATIDPRFSIQRFIPEPITFSFPSGHTATAVAVVCVLALNYRWGKWFFLLALWIGGSRVLVGVHYPSDILGGGCVGLIAFLMIQRLFEPGELRKSRSLI
jgi:undecaprenyl-diphosphatase